MSELPKSTKKNMGKKMLLAAVAVVLLAVAIGAGIYNTPANRLTRHLDLGQKYLEDCGYEAAIVAFQNAIAIDDRCEEGYLGLAEAYVQVEQYEQAAETYEALLEIAPTNVEGYLGLADIYLDKSEIEQALDTLDKGYELTEEKTLQDKIAQCLAAYIEENREILDKLMQRGINGGFLTYEQWRELWIPYLPICERYLECDDEDDVYVLGECLAGYYLKLGEYEKCLEVRRQAYERTGYERMKPEESESVVNGTRYVYDKYGRNIVYSSNKEDEKSNTYHEYNDEKREYMIWDDYYEHGSDIRQYVKWDAEGRTYESIYEAYVDDTDILMDRLCYTFEYDGDRVVWYGRNDYHNPEYSNVDYGDTWRQEGIIDEYGEVTWTQLDE